MLIARSYAALIGEVVTDAHVKCCKERGHATYTKDGVVSKFCPRCGEKLPEKVTLNK